MRRERSGLAITLWALAISVAAGAGFGAAVSEDAARGALVGVVAGGTIGGTLAAFEQFAAPAGRVARLLAGPVARTLAIRVAVYLAVILAGLLLGRIAGAEDGVVNTQGLGRDIGFSLVGALAVNLGTQMARVLGPRALGDLLLGRYHLPRVEERVFLLLDMVGSTAAAEAIGSTRFHALLDRIAVAAGRPILASGGEVDAYVGDGIVAAWTLARGVRDAACLRAAAGALDAVAAIAGDCRREFGAAPALRAALHAGPVTVGELGDRPRRIVMLGDPLNTAARIEQAARELGEPLVVSADLLARLSLPAGWHARPLPDRPLRGKSRTVPLFALDRVAGPRAGAGVP